MTTGSISIASFAGVTGAPVGIVSARFSLAFSIFTGIMKKLLKITRNKKKKHSKTVMLATSKLNSIESKISEALINSEIVMKTVWQLFIKKKISRIKRKIRLMNSQRSDNEKINLIEEGKKNRHWQGY